MDRLTRIRVQNLRALVDVSLELRPLTVLIGENGTGKSSFVEACRLLRLASAPGFLHSLLTIHGGGPGLLSAGASTLSLSVDLEGDGPALRYDLEVGLSPGQAEIVREALHVSDGQGGDARWRELPLTVPLAPTPSRGGHWRMGSFELALVDTPARRWEEELARVRAALSAVEVHANWDICARWVARANSWSVPVRGSSLLTPTRELALSGGDLASAWHTLKNELGPEHWRTTLEYARLGLGEDLSTVDVRVDEGGGNVYLALRWSGLEREVRAHALSDGQIMWLIYVALARLPAEGGLLVIDEPEMHLHPRLLGRLADLAESMGQTRPVLLATHSDRLLDALRDPADSVAVLELDQARRSVLRRLDPTALHMWLAGYRGYGDLRSEGLDRYVLSEVES